MNASDVIANRIPKESKKKYDFGNIADKVLFKYTGLGSYTTPSGVKFTKTDPFNVVSKEEAHALLNDTNSFKIAYKEDVKKHYNI
jgi:hypothetical protein